MAEISIELEACEPMELMRNPFKQKVWIQFCPTKEYWPLIDIRGEEEEVWQFIATHWDQDVADQMVFGVGPYA